MALDRYHILLKILGGIILFEIEIDLVLIYVIYIIYMWFSEVLKDGVNFPLTYDSWRIPIRRDSNVPATFLM